MEAQALLEHLPMGGRWIELGYPKSRWEREGRMPFDKWGQKTDGGAPWIEWHDLEKLRYVLAPANFDVVLDLEFHDSDFNWFDLVRVSVACTTSKPQLHDKREERDRTPEFLARIEELQSQVVALQSSNEKQRQGLDLLNREKQQLERLWQATQKSAGWRLLNSWRQLRDRIAAPATSRRKLYDMIVGTLRDRQPK